MLAALQSAEAENGGKREQGASYLGDLREGCLAVLARCCPLPRPLGTTENATNNPLPQTPSFCPCPSHRAGNSNTGVGNQRDEPTNAYIARQE